MSVFVNNLKKANKVFDKSDDRNVFYPTHILGLDYMLGKYVTTYTKAKEEYKAKRLGIRYGTMNGIVGASGSSKSSTAAKMGYNIIKPFEHGFMFIIDTEPSWDLSRIEQVTGANSQEIEQKIRIKRNITRKKKVDNKFVEFNDSIGHNGFIQILNSIKQQKLAMGKEIMYDTGEFDKLGKPILAYQPTVVILDSLNGLIPENIVEDIAKSEELKNTAKLPMDIAKCNSQVFRILSSICEPVNIIVFVTNHCLDNVSMGGPTSNNDVNMIPFDVAIPGGKAFKFYSDSFIMMQASSSKANKYKISEGDPFDGFKVNAYLIKSRGNRAGKSTPLAFSQTNGINAIQHIYLLLEQHGLLRGSRRPYAVDNCDVKFKETDFIFKFKESPELRKACLDVLKPELEKTLSVFDESIDDNQDYFGDYY